MTDSAWSRIGVAGQDAGEHAGRDHHEGHDERRRDHPGRAADAVDDRKRATSAAGIAVHVREILGGRRAEQEQPEDPADEPRLDAGDGLDRGPARDFEQHAARDRDRHVGPDAEPLGAERRDRVEERDQRRDDNDPETLTPSTRSDQPREDQRRRIGDGGEEPGLGKRHAVPRAADAAACSPDRSRGRKSG